MAEPLLDIRGLKTHFATDDGMVRAVDGVDLTINRGETVGIVGESGCGKTVTAMTVLKLIAMPPGRIVEGQILWRGRDLVPLNADGMRKIRSKEIGIIFQEPMTSLNPVYTVGDQIAEVIRLHDGLGRKDAMDKAAEMLRLVNIPTPERRVHDYPHQFSGGMRQRVAIALALALNPKLVIADEPVTALDVIVQRQILDQLRELQTMLGISVILVTHDISVVAYVCDRTVVMYAGRVAEAGAMEATLTRPAHPYTMGLRNAFPDLQGAASGTLTPIEGAPPNLADPPPGCRFAPRCPFVLEICTKTSPVLSDISPDHAVACHRAGEAAVLRERAARVETWMTETGMTEA